MRVTHGRGDPLQELLAREPAGDLDQRAANIAAAHRIAAARAEQHQDKQTAEFHRRCAGAVLRILREIG